MDSLPIQYSSTDLKPVDFYDPNNPGSTPTDYLDPYSSSPKSTDTYSILSKPSANTSSILNYVEFLKTNSSSSPQELHRKMW